MVKLCSKYSNFIKTVRFDERHFSSCECPNAHFLARRNRCSQISLLAEIGVCRNPQTPGEQKSANKNQENRTRRTTRRSQRPICVAPFAPRKPDSYPPFAPPAVPCSQRLRETGFAPVTPFAPPDVDFRHLVYRLPKGASFTILSYSCHSGGLIEKEKEQIGPTSFSFSSSSSTIERDQNGNKSLSFRPKIIPFQSILQHFISLTNINTSDIVTHLLETFGANASLKFRLPFFDLELLEPQLKPDDGGILLSGCQADETSADISPNTKGGKAYGAFSNAVEMVLKEKSGQMLSNRELVMEARKVLKSQGFVQQYPCLYCRDENADAAFLGLDKNSE